MPAGKLEHEIGSVEIKHSIVIDQFGACPEIFNKQGGVSVQFIYGLAGLTCQKADAYAVSLSLGNRHQEYYGSQND